MSVKNCADGATSLSRGQHETCHLGACRVARHNREKGEALVSDLVRFGVSIDERLLDRFDELITEKSYVNRSEALRDLIRGALVEDQWEAGDAEAIGTVTLVYDHHSRDLADKLTDHQHTHHEEIVSTLHVHLDANLLPRGGGAARRRARHQAHRRRAHRHQGRQARQLRGHDHRRDRVGPADCLPSPPASPRSTVSTASRASTPPVHRVDPRAKVITTAVFIVCVVSHGKYDLLGLLAVRRLPRRPRN